MAISVPDFYRLVKDLPHDHPVPNTKGNYGQWGFKKPHANGTIEIFKLVRSLLTIISLDVNFNYCAWRVPLAYSTNWKKASLVLDFIVKISYSYLDTE